MIKVSVRTNTTRKEVTAEVTDTPATVFSKMGISMAGSVISLDGKFLNQTDCNSSFDQLGVVDGSIIGLSANVKADGAIL